MSARPEHALPGCKWQTVNLHYVATFPGVLLEALRAEPLWTCTHVTQGSLYGRGYPYQAMS